MAGADQLIEVFNMAKLRPAGPERDEFLAESCGDDAELKKQILSLLKAHEKAGDFMLAQPASSPMLDTELLRLKPEKAGGRIGPYMLREKIGEGGFGTVWAAEQQLPVRRMVALKIIKLGMDTRDVVARFEQERQALAVMDHPNIAKVFDAGATGEGRPYFVMEMVHGIRITDYCDQANLPTPERLALFMQVCHAVQHAHQKGIIHRDLKPSNILVTLQDGVPVPKVIDFGVAKATQGPLTELTIHTRALEMVGTPLYMSPEQAERDGLDVDTRTDIYALGVLLYELLTGRTPFDADILRKAGYDEVRRIIREQEPQKPSTALHTMAQGTLTSVAQHRASEPPKLIHAIRGDLDWIVMKTLEKDRARRYDTANGLAADIRRHLENEPVTARPPGRAYRFQKLVRRNKLAFFFSAAILAALLIGLATTTWMYLRESDALAKVSAERDAKEVARQEAEDFSTFMYEVFHSPNPMRDGRTITVAETLDTAAKKLETELANQPARRNSMLAALGNSYDALGLHSQAIPIREETLKYRRTVSGLDHPMTPLAMHSLATSYSAVGRWEEALKLREEVVALRRKTLAPEHPDMLAAVASLADSYVKSGRLEEALKIREEVLLLHRKVLGPEHLGTIWSMQNLAISYDTVDRHDEALKLREEVLPLCRKVLGPKHPTTLTGMQFLANSYTDARRLDEALKLREEALPLLRKVLGPEHPTTLRAITSLANSYAGAGRREEALMLREEALPLLRKLSGPEHSDTLLAMKDLANSYAGAGRQDEALMLREEVLPLCRKVSGPEHSDTLKAMKDLANSYLRAGRIVEALPLLEEVSTRKPDDLVSATNVAILQAWFAREAGYVATCQRMLDCATDAKPEDAGRIATLTCLRPIDDVSMRQTTLALAQRAVELGHENKVLSAWQQMTLGMAEYRNGHYHAADQALITAEKTASATGAYRPPLVKNTSSLYRVMSLFQQGRQAEARELFTATESKMKPLPVDEKHPLADGKTDCEYLIFWLACKEARALINVLPAGKP